MCRRTALGHHRTIRCGLPPLINAVASDPSHARGEGVPADRWGDPRRVGWPTVPDVAGLVHVAVATRVRPNRGGRTDTVGPRASQPGLPDRSDRGRGRDSTRVHRRDPRSVFAIPSTRGAKRSQSHCRRRSGTPHCGDWRRRSVGLVESSPTRDHRRLRCAPCYYRFRSCPPRNPSALERHLDREQHRCDWTSGSAGGGGRTKPAPWETAVNPVPVGGRSTDCHMAPGNRCGRGRIHRRITACWARHRGGV